MNRYTEVYYAPDTSCRDFKQLVQHYDDLTDQQVRLKNKIKARLRVQGIIVRDGRLFTRKGRAVVLEKVPSQDVRQATLQLYSVPRRL
jgi:transposase